MRGGRGGRIRGIYLLFHLQIQLPLDVGRQTQHPLPRLSRGTHFVQQHREHLLNQANQPTPSNVESLHYNRPLRDTFRNIQELLKFT